MFNTILSTKAQYNGFYTIKPTRECIWGRFQSFASQEFSGKVAGMYHAEKKL